MTDDTEARRRQGQLAELGMLTASLLHELRQPLFAARAFVELEVVGRGEPGGLARALEQLDHLEELVNWYGGLGRSGDAPTLIELHEVARSVTVMLGHRARLRPCTLTLEPPVVPPLWVRGRPGALRQILINLTANALDAPGVRRVVLRVHGPMVDGRAVAAVDVVDDGTGIPDAIQASVFDAFVSARPNGEGTGLGLPIARDLARELGGDVVLVATGPQGTTMRLWLPPGTSDAR